MARGSVGRISACQIGKVLALPWFRGWSLCARHLIYRVVKPRMPFWWDAAGIVGTVIDNPTPAAATRRNAPLVIVFAAFGIHANLLAAQPGKNMCNCRRHRETPFLTDLSSLICHQRPAPSSIHTTNESTDGAQFILLHFLKRILTNSSNLYLVPQYLLKNHLPTTKYIALLNRLRLTSWYPLDMG
jgi:hypothetical protein